jgi:hypothetical protein
MTASARGWARVTALLALILTQCVAGGGSRPLVSRMAALGADTDTYRMTPATVVQKLQPIVPVTADEPTTAEWTFSGAAAAAGVVWARAYFQEGNAAGKWEFLQLRLGLNPPDGDRQALADALATELTNRMGKSIASRSDERTGTRSWTLGDNRVVSVEVGTFENPIDGARVPVVLVEIAVAQGDSEPGGPPD